MCHRRTFQISHFGYHVRMLIVDIRRVPIEAGVSFSLACDSEVADQRYARVISMEMREIFLKLYVSNVQDTTAVFRQFGMLFTCVNESRVRDRFSGGSTVHRVVASLQGPHGFGAVRPTMSPLSPMECTTGYCPKYSLYETDISFGIPEKMTIGGIYVFTPFFWVTGEVFVPINTPNIFGAYPCNISHVCLKIRGLQTSIEIYPILLY